MVLEQAVASTGLRNWLIIPRIQSANSNVLSVIRCPNLYPPSAPSVYSPYKNHSFKCSMNDYKHQFSGDNNNNQAQVSYPKPSEIPWKKELCNSLNLIGIVAVPVEIKHFPSGKVLAWTRLTVKKNATQTFWVNLTFWDELAHVAFQHVEKGHQIYVSGRLVTETAQSVVGKQQTYYKVYVQQLNFIDRSLLPVTPNDSESGSMMTGRKGNYGANNAGSTEQLWQAFFANPEEWWDNRKNKRSPKYPDFKHKDTGEALWVEGRSNPPWVKSQLAILEMRMESLTDQNDRTPANMVAANEFSSF